MQKNIIKVGRDKTKGEEGKLGGREGFSTRLINLIGGIVVKKK